MYLKKYRSCLMFCSLLLVITVPSGCTPLGKFTSSFNQSNTSTSTSLKNQTSNTSNNSSVTTTNQELQSPTPSPTPLPTNTPSPTPDLTNLVKHTGPISHAFFHCLIAFPEIAYSGKIPNLFDRDCVTPTEFKKSLQEFYDKDYILIDINSTFEIAYENGKKIVKDKQLMLPEGKKPLVISIDDIVYDPKKKGKGMVDKIILDSTGRLATYTKHIDGTEVISYDNDVIPIIEQFLNDHPDFSWQGAKATLAVTGWVGVLGYRIDRLESNRSSEIAAVKPIIEKLKQNGWNFASHGYGHRHTDNISYELLVDDTDKWKNEIEAVVGPTSIYVYPYGERVKTTDPKYKYLMDAGFSVFCGVGIPAYWKNYGDSVLMSRQCIDGYTLRNFNDKLSPWLDTKKVLETKYRDLVKVQSKY